MFLVTFVNSIMENMRKLFFGSKIISENSSIITEVIIITEVTEEILQRLQISSIFV